MSKLYSGTVVVLATLTPRPGKLQAVSCCDLYFYEKSAHMCIGVDNIKVLELAQPVIQFAQDYEKGCFEFQVFTEVNPEGVEQIFTIERSVATNVQQIIKSVAYGRTETDSKTQKHSPCTKLMKLWKLLTRLLRKKTFL